MPGRHNQNMEASIQRLHKGKTYRDLTTAIVCPTRGSIPVEVVNSWIGLMRPMNQTCMGPLHFSGFEVADAYNQAVEYIFAVNAQAKANKQRPIKYMLTVEEDNVLPPDCLLKLLENIDSYDAIGGLYWTKGDGGQPMIYGNPHELPLNFIPQVPVPEAVQECNGLGMGCTLFKFEIFEKMDPPKDHRGQRQWFETRQKFTPGVGGECFTQDLWFFNEAKKKGFRFASDNRVKVGHLDIATGIEW